MPVYRACTLVCDGCSAESPGYLAEEGVVHHADWIVVDDPADPPGRPSLAYCPACAKCPPPPPRTTGTTPP
jgi:hypothetical protein